jgi:hypothetical protein
MYRGQHVNAAHLADSDAVKLASLSIKIHTKRAGTNRVGEGLSDVAEVHVVIHKTTMQYNNPGKLCI